MERQCWSKIEDIEDRSDEDDDYNDDHSCALKADNSD
jgi:hypothetical protein